MNYFRSVTSILNYQIATEKMRKGNVYKEDVPGLLNKILNIYSIDDDKPILRDKIEKETLPELQKIMSKRSGNSVLLQDVGKALNTNIETILNDEYKLIDDSILNPLSKEENKKTLRIEGTNVIQASRDPDIKQSTALHNKPILFKENITEKQKKEAYFEIIKITIKLGMFASNALNLDELSNALNTNKELKQAIYDTIINRGCIIEDIENPEKQLEDIINNIIKPGIKLLIDKKKDNTYINMKKNIENEDKYPKHISEVLQYIKDNLLPKLIERHKYGEVFTPIELVNEMLDTLPSEVWNNKKLKWLDPANGMGNFPILVFLRLYYGFRISNGKYVGITENGDGKYNPGLTKIIPNDKLRQTHIVKNMLYMVELNNKNITISKKLFHKLAPDIDANIIQLDKIKGFLSDKSMTFPNGTENSFDIVMGNPPFNKGSVRVAMVTNKTKKEREKIGIEDSESESGFWVKFVDKILNNNILKKNGYLLFIHPISWFKKDKAGAHDLLLSKQLHNLKIYKNDKSAQKLFEGKGKISIAYYLLENTPTSKIKTRIEYADYINKTENIILNTNSIIIQNYNSIYSKIINKCKLFMDTNGLKHNQITACNDSGTHKLITILEGNGTIKYIHSSTPHRDQKIPKIIVGGTSTPIVLFDKKGEYGLYKKGQRHYFIGPELDKINDYFKTKLSTLLLKYTKFEQDFIKPGYSPDIRTIDLDVINDVTLADYFGFTKEERAEIEEMPYPIHPTSDKIIKLNCSQLTKTKKNNNE
jgi:hypothetical protein